MVYGVEYSYLTARPRRQARGVQCCSYPALPNAQRPKTTNYQWHDTNPLLRKRNFVLIPTLTHRNDVCYCFGYRAAQATERSNGDNENGREPVLRAQCTCLQTACADTLQTGARCSPDARAPRVRSFW